jgi:flagellar basal-body rod protein FlgB
LLSSPTARAPVAFDRSRSPPRRQRSFASRCVERGARALHRRDGNRQNPHTLESTVGEINDAAIMDALRRQLTLASAKQVVAAGNLANINTPGFRAREVDFDRVLDGQLQAAAQLLATDDRHIGVPGATGPAVRETADAAARRDGNTVQLDRELLSMTRAAGEFAAAQTALAAKFRLVRYAINEAR